MLSIAFFDFLPLNLLLVRIHQADIIILKCLIQRCNNMCNEDGSCTLTRSTNLSVLLLKIQN